MIFGSYSPIWFLGFDSLLEGLFFFITLLIAWYAYRIYRFGGGPHYKWWAGGFALISLAYVINAATNLALYLELQETTQLATKILDIVQVYRIGLFVHTAVFLTGYLLLALVSLRVTDRRVASLLFGLVILVALGSLSGVPLLEISTSLLIVYIILSLAQRASHTTTNRLVIISFAAILLGQLAYVLIPVWNVSYVAGHILEFLGYGSLFASMVVILRT